MKRNIYQKPSITMVVYDNEPLLAGSVTGCETSETPADKNTSTLSNLWMFLEEEGQEQE